MLVADIAIDHFVIAITTPDKQMLGRRTVSVDVSRGPDEVVELMASAFDELLEELGIPDAEALAISVGIPGPVDSRRGVVVRPPLMPGWDGYPVRDRLASRYQAPVWVDNDVNVLTLGEWRAGVATGHDNVVVVKIGTGIGAGIISDGRLHRGAPLPFLTSAR